jgi:2-C-methyl-D-erythritol 4-phosphate cytidylyltransferase
MVKGTDLYTSAVIVAAGLGTRMGMDIKKQFIKICGIPVLARTLQVFEDCRFIDEIILVVHSSDIILSKNEIVDRYDFTKVKSIVSGGETRQNSVSNGLNNVDEQCRIVLIHDGARPFIKEDEITSLIEAAAEFGACTIATPVKDTIKLVDDNDFIKSTIDRSTIWSVQTPQAFSYQAILAAHAKAVDDRFTGTDDAQLVERMGIPVKLIKGSYDNIKITTKEDLAVAQIIAENDII